MRTPLTSGFLADAGVRFDDLLAAVRLLPVRDLFLPCRLLSVGAGGRRADGVGGGAVVGSGIDSVVGGDGSDSTAGCPALA